MGRVIGCSAVWQQLGMPIAFHCRPPHNGQLVQERFPVCGHSSRWSGCGLTSGMCMWRKQFHTFGHGPLLVVEEPVLTRLKAGYDRMSCCRRMPGCMLTRRTVTASDVPTLRTPAEMKPPPFRRRQAFHTPVTTWFRSEINPTVIFLHFDLSFFRHRFTSASREAKHQPRLVGYPVGVKLCHLVEQLFVRRRGLLQPIKVQQIALSVLDRRR